VCLCDTDKISVIITSGWLLAPVIRLWADLRRVLNVSNNNNNIVDSVITHADSWSAWVGCSGMSV